MVYRSELSVGSSGSGDYSTDLSRENSFANYYAKFGSRYGKHFEDNVYSSYLEEREQMEESSVTESFASVETPSVQDSVETTDESTRMSFIADNERKRLTLPPSNTPRLRTPDIMSIPSAATPSILGNKGDDNYNRMMEASDIDTVVNSVMSSLMNDRERQSNKPILHQQLTSNIDYVYDDDDGIYDEQSEANEMSFYDQFMQNFQQKSTNIVQKSSVGLMNLQRKGTPIRNGNPSQTPPKVRQASPIPASMNRGRDLTALPSNAVNRSKTPSSKPPSGPLVSTRTKKQMESSFNAPGNNDSRIPYDRKEQQLNTKDKMELNITAELFDVVSEVSAPSALPLEISAPGQFARNNIIEEDSHALELRQMADSMLKQRRYDELIPLVQAYPSIVAMQQKQPNMRNFIHLITMQQKPVPENIILKIISLDASLVAAADSFGNIPLHYAALNARKENMYVFLVMLKFHPLGAMQRNNDGDLPLHLAAANPNRGAQMAVHMLLETNSKALTEPNKKGKIPLHLAMTPDSTNLKSLKTILNVHKARKYTVIVKDNKGNTPLHAAILSGTGYQAIELFNRFVREMEIGAYTKENEQRYLPLHLALRTKKINPLVVLSLLKSAPFVAGVPTPSGDMPIHLATKAQLKPEIIKTILAADLPIELGSNKGNTSMGVIVHREHGNSWWHVAVEMRSEYVDVVTSLLTDFATYIQIIALARSVGPDKKTVTIDAVSPPLKDAFRNLLRFYYRYEISTLKMPICSNETQSFPAFDHGEDIEKLKVTGPWLKSGFTKIKENHLQTTATEQGREIMYVPWEPDEMEITLRCYAFEEHFKAEKTFREKHNISSEYVETMISYHNDSNYVNISFSTGKMLCISFERNDGTLGELLSSNLKIRSEAAWLSSCQRMLNDIAHSLSHLHDNGLVHGRLDTDTFAKFGEKWKLLEIGKSTAMGNAMGGCMHKFVPPESLSGVKTDTSTSGISPQRRNSRSNLRANKRSSSVIKGGLGPASRISSNLPPLHNFKDKSEKKNGGIFSFGLKDLGLGSFGTKKSKGKGGRGTSDNSVLSGSSMDSSIASIKKKESNVTDEVSARVIAMQEDEIARLRKALEEKEHIYRRQLAEERATYKRLEVERQREVQNKFSAQKNKLVLPRYAPEKLMASALWDVWSYGIIMAEVIIGKSPLLPCSADTDEDFLLKLSNFDEIKLSALCEEVKDAAGPLAADLVGRLLNPKPQQRISCMDKVLQHRYFHEEVIEAKKVNNRGRASKVTITVSNKGRSLSRKRK